MRLNPEATFDALYVAQRLQAAGASFSIPELHLMAYLACLLSIYRKQAATDWGYPFVGTELGAPFSPEMDKALKELIGRGFFLRSQDRLQITDLAGEQLAGLQDLTINQERAECLNAACASTAVFSIGMLCSAIAQEPELRRAQDLPTARILLEEATRSQLYKQFDALRQALRRQSDDLRLPAVVWLTALYRSIQPATVPE